MKDLIPSGKKGSLFTGFDLDDFGNELENFFSRRWPAKGNFLKVNFKLDVQENDKDYLIEADLPGIKKEEVKVDLDNGELTISVDREEKIDEEKKNYIHKERRYNSMSRSIYLTNAKVEGITAKLENGVLKITVPKGEKPDTSVKINIE
jgi:HSP20 family protein